MFVEHFLSLLPTYINLLLQKLDLFVVKASIVRKHHHLQSLPPPGWSVLYPTQQMPVCTT